MLVERAVLEKRISLTREATGYIVNFMRTQQPLYMMDKTCKRFMN